MEFEEYQRLTRRKSMLNKIFERAFPSDFTHEEWEDMYKEYAEICEKLHYPGEQSAQERKLQA